MHSIIIISIIIIVIIIIISISIIIISISIIIIIIIIVVIIVIIIIIIILWVGTHSSIEGFASACTAVSTQDEANILASVFLLYNQDSREILESLCRKTG